MCPLTSCLNKNSHVLPGGMRTHPALCIGFVQKVTSALYDGICYVTPPQNYSKQKAHAFRRAENVALPQICKHRTHGLYITPIDSVL